MALNEIVRLMSLLKITTISLAADNAMGTDGAVSLAAAVAMVLATILSSLVVYVVRRIEGVSDIKSSRRVEQSLQLRLGQQSDLRLGEGFEIDDQDAE